MRLAGPHAEAAEQVTSTHHALFALADDGQPGRSVRRLKLERPVRPMGVVVLEIHPKDLRQMATSDSQQPAQALGADRPHPALGVRVRSGCPHRRHQPRATLRAEHLVEAAGELGVPVAEQEVQASSSLFQDQQEVAGLLVVRR
jgi:hypothetical protein